MRAPSFIAISWPSPVEPHRLFFGNRQHILNDPIPGFFTDEYGQIGIGPAGRGRTVFEETDAVFYHLIHYPA